MPKYQDIVQRISQVEIVTLNVKKELKTLKNRVRAYKGWTKKYRNQQKELKQINLVVCKQRDEAVQELQELKLKQQSLWETIEAAKKAKQQRDEALLQLDEVINKIEQYKKICDQASQIAYADKIYLIREAEKLFFDEEIININIEFDPKSQSQMFTDRASINRNLLDN
jgi:thioesterase domain-containing protein